MMKMKQQTPRKPAKTTPKATAPVKVKVKGKTPSENTQAARKRAEQVEPELAREVTQQKPIPKTPVRRKKAPQARVTR